MAKRYYWLKLRDDFFSSIKMKKLRKNDDGDLLTIIYLKIQLLSVKTGGLLRFEGVEATFEEELALLLDEDVYHVRTTVEFLKSQGMLERLDEHQYLLTDAASSIGSESESSARVRKLRYKEQDHALHFDDFVTPDKEKDSETENDTEKEREPLPEQLLDDTTLLKLEQTFKLYSVNPPDIRPHSQKVLYQQIQNLYNNTCTHLPRCNLISESRKRVIRARFREGKRLEDFKVLFEKARTSRFLRGENPRGWVASFDWLLKEVNMVKVLDGNYDNRGGIVDGCGFDSQTAGQDANRRFEEISGGLQL